MMNRVFWFILGLLIALTAWSKIEEVAKKDQMDEVLPLSSSSGKILPDCTPYTDLRKAENAVQDKNWRGKDCFDNTSLPMNVDSLLGMKSGIERVDADWLIDTFNRELHRDSFLTTWESRDFFRNLYPDIPFKASEGSAKICGLEIAKCERKEWKCSGDFLKERLENEKIHNLDNHIKGIDEDAKKAYLGEQVRRSILLSAYIDAVNELEKKRKSNSKRKVEMNFVGDMGASYTDARTQEEKEADDKEIERLKEMYQTGIDSIRIESPLLFKEDADGFKRVTSSTKKSLKQLLREIKMPHEESDLTKKILKEVDPKGNLKKKFIELLNTGNVDNQTIAREIFESKQGNEKTISEKLQDKKFMDMIDKEAKKATDNHIDVLAQSALITCKKRGDTDPYIHHFPEVVVRTLKRMENHYKNDTKDKNEFAYYQTRIKAGYCYAKEKYPSIDTNVSKLLEMGAAATSAGIAALPFTEGASGVLVIAGGALSLVGAKDAWMSDRNLLEVYGNKYAKTSQIGEYYKAAGYNNALVGLDAGLLALDGILVARKVMKEAANLKRLNKVTGQLEDLPHEDQVVISNIYYKMKDNIAKSDPTMKQLLEEAETNPETKDLMLAVIDKLKRDLEEGRKMSGVTTKEIEDELAKKLNACLTAKEGISPFPVIR